MKFLEDEELSKLTVQLTGAPVGTGERIIDGRIEAFTMKRAGTDKKVAHELTEKYQHEIQVEEKEFEQIQKKIQKYRSESIGSVAEVQKRRSSSIERISFSPSSSSSPQKSSPKSRKSGSGGSRKGRRRSQSLGTSDLKGILKNNKRNCRSRSESFSMVPTASSSSLYSNSPLGDFSNTCTQRLMTDLILTLNASFPDYDFSSIKPSHFSKLPSSTIVINRTYEKLSEFSASSPQGNSFLPKLWGAIDDVITLSECEIFSYAPPDDPLDFLTQTLVGGSADDSTAFPLWTFNYFFVNKALKRILFFTCVQTMHKEELGLSDMEENDIVGEDSNAAAEIKEDSSFGQNDYSAYRMNSNLLKTSKIVFGGEQNPIDVDNDEEDDNGSQDFDMDADCMSQAALLPTTVA